MNTFSIASHLTPTPPTKLQSNKLESDKSVELAGSGVTSIFPKRSDRTNKEDRRPNWVNGLLYYLRRKEKGRSSSLHVVTPVSMLGCTHCIIELL